MLRLKENTGKKITSDDGLIPMINIVFLLLIFFMVAGQISTITPTDLELPLSKSDAELDTTDTQIYIERDGSMLVNGSPVLGSLEQALIDSGTSNDSVIVCRVHNTLPASVLDPVMKAARSLGLTQIRFATDSD